MNWIIIINGAAGAGKDTFVKLCERHTSAYTANFSLIAPIVELCRNSITGWDGVKTPESRKLLEGVLNSLMEYNLNPFKIICKKIETLFKDESLGQKDKLIFVHVRQGSYIKLFIETFEEDALTLHIDSEKADHTVTKADAETKFYGYDFYISNNSSIHSLELQAIGFLKRIGLWCNNME